MHPEAPLMRWLWPFLAAMAGSLTALSMRQFKKMTPLEISIALVVGVVFSVFVSPWIVHTFYGPLPTVNLYLLGFVFYLTATGWNIILPFLVRHLLRIIGNGKTEEVEP